MASISLCMIVRDEEAVLGRCLESVAPAVDEIIVVDTGSMDGTKAVAAAYTDRIFDFAWVDDFAAARNASFAKHRGLHPVAGRRRCAVAGGSGCVVVSEKSAGPIPGRCGDDALQHRF